MCVQVLVTGSLHLVGDVLRLIRKWRVEYTNTKSQYIVRFWFFFQHRLTKAYNQRQNVVSKSQIHKCYTTSFWFISFRFRNQLKRNVPNGWCGLKIIWAGWKHINNHMIYRRNMKGMKSTKLLNTQTSAVETHWTHKPQQWNPHNNCKFFFLF